MWTLFLKGMRGMRTKAGHIKFNSKRVKKEDDLSIDKLILQLTLQPMEQMMMHPMYEYHVQIH